MDANEIYEWKNNMKKGSFPIFIWGFHNFYTSVKSSQQAEGFKIADDKKPHVLYVVASINYATLLWLPVIR